MNDANILDKPSIHTAIEAKCQEIGFTMPSDLHIGTLLKTLISSKPAANVLELGTSLGITTAYLASANTAVPVITMEGAKARISTIA